MASDPRARGRIGREAGEGENAQAQKDEIAHEWSPPTVTPLLGRCYRILAQMFEMECEDRP